MTTKKSRKKVLDYDPLAWLGEDQKTSTGKTVKKSAASKKPPKSANADTQEVKKKVNRKKSKVKNEPVKAEVASQQPEVESEVTENVHFGFFEEEGPLDKVAEPTASSKFDTVIELGESLTIKTVADVKRRIEQNLEQHQDIVLDSTDLLKIDTAGLQMLFSLQKSLVKDHQKMNWKFCSPVIQSAAKLSGLGEIVEGDSAGIETDESSAQQKSITQPAANQGFGFF